MARAARKKQVKRKQRRTDARGKRVERPGARAARGSTARTRTAARKRVAKKLARKVDATKRALKKRVASVKRAVKVAVAKRVVKKRVASLKRSVAKGVATARTRVKTAKKRVTAAGNAFQRRVKRTVKAAKATLKRARRTLAPRRALVKPLKPVPSAFAVQRATATAREQLLFELQRARATVKAAVQGLASGLAERPIAPGKWSIKEIVLHLSERDRVRLEEFARTLGGQSRSWAGIEDPQMGVHNEVHLAPLRAHGWDDALRRLDSLREQLLLRLSEVPAHPDDVWQPGHPFADMMWGLPEHDRHHAIQIKLARIGVEDPVEE